MSNDPLPIMTIGYEGISAEELIAELKKGNVDLLLDVRIRAGSRKKGLSKTSLSENLNLAGIEYEHDRDLGTPKEIMKEFRETGKYDWDAYLKFLKSKMPSVRQAAELSKTKRICLLCYELDAQVCHRRFVAEEISMITHGPIVHLRNQPGGLIEP